MVGARIPRRSPGATRFAALVLVLAAAGFGMLASCAPADPWFSVGRKDPERKAAEETVISELIDVQQRLEACDRYPGSIRSDLGEGRNVFAMDSAANALKDLARAEETLDTLMREHRECTRIPPGAWTMPFPMEWKQAHLEAFRQLPRLRAEFAGYPQFRRESYLQLSPDELALHYSMYSLTPALKHAGPISELDFPAELRQRAVAARALRERVAQPDKFRDFKDDCYGGPKPWESRIMSQAGWVAGYEVVLAEANWLLAHAPEGARAEGAKTVAEIAAGLPAVRRDYGALLADPDKNVREKAVSWLQFHRDQAVLYQMSFIKDVPIHGLADPAVGKAPENTDASLSEAGRRAQDAEVFVSRNGSACLEDAGLRLIDLRSKGNPRRRSEAVKPKPKPEGWMPARTLVERWAAEEEGELTWLDGGATVVLSRRASDEHMEIFRKLFVDQNAFIRRVSLEKALEEGNVNFLRLVLAEADKGPGRAREVVQALLKHSCFGPALVIDPRRGEALARGALADPDKDVRSGAVYQIGESRAPQAAALLGLAVRDADPGVRDRAIWKLGEFRGPEAAAGLAVGLSCPDVKARQLAALFLGRMGPDAPRFLAKAQEDADVGVRWQAVASLGKAGGPEAVKLLARGLEDSEPDVRWRAAYALGATQGPAAAAAAEALRKRLDPEMDGNVREAIVYSLMGR